MNGSTTRTMKTKAWTKAPVPSDILAALEELGIEYQVSGDDAKILCPWHDDRKPSCYVHTTSGVTHCFSCGSKGQFVKVVKTILGTGWDQAALWCQTRATGRLRASQDREEPPEKKLPRSVSEADLALFTDPPECALRDRAISFAAARGLGILWDEENDSWIIPIREPYTGKLLGWQSKGRDVVQNYPRRVPKASTLFGLGLAVRSSPARRILVESPLDVGRLHTAGAYGGVASYGVHVSDEQLVLIAATSERLVCAFDRDTEGFRESDRIRREFLRLPVTFFDYGRSRCKDPGEMTDEEILWGIENSTRSLVTRFC